MKEDEKIYKAFIKGDNEAFNMIMKLYGEDVITFLQKFVQDRDTAEDLSQDVFVYILVNKKEYDFKYSFRTYLYTIARSRAINYIKKSKREISFEEEVLELEEVPSDFKVESNIITEENKEEVMKALSKLKEEYKTILILKDFEDFSYKEICKIMNKTMSQVKVLLYRARAALKDNLNEEDYKC